MDKKIAIGNWPFKFREATRAFVNHLSRGDRCCLGLGKTGGGSLPDGLPDPADLRVCDQENNRTPDGVCGLC
jgi:hypothetical protein